MVISLRGTASIALAAALTIGCGSAPPQTADGASDPPAGSAAASPPDTPVAGDGLAEPAAEDKNKAAPDSPSPRAAGAPAGDDGDVLDAPAGSYTPLELAKYMPQTCRGRVYVNVTEAVGSEMAALKQLIEPLVAKEDRKGEMRKALKILVDGGLDPYKVLREVVACDRPDVAVVSFDATRGGDPLAVLQRAAKAIGARRTAIESMGSIRMLVVDRREAVALVKPGMVVVGDRKKIEPAIKAMAGAAGFADASRYVLWARDREFDVKVSARGSNLELLFATPTRRTAERAIEEAREETNEIADYLQKTPVSLLADRLRAVRFSVKSSKLVARGSLSRGDIRQVIRAVRKLNARQLENLVEGRYGRKPRAMVAPPPPPPPPPPPRK